MAVDVDTVALVGIRLVCRDSCFLPWLVMCVVGMQKRKLHISNIASQRQLPRDGLSHVHLIGHHDDGI